MTTLNILVQAVGVQQTFSTLSFDVCAAGDTYIDAVPTDELPPGANPCVDEGNADCQANRCNYVSIVLTTDPLLELALKRVTLCVSASCPGEKGDQGPVGPQGVCSCVCSCTAQDFDFNLQPGVPVSQAGYMNFFNLPDNTNVIVAAGYVNDGTGTPAQLSSFGTDDTGLGIWEQTNHYLDDLHFIQFDMADVIRTRDNRCDPVQITISHICTGYGFSISGSNTKGEIGVEIHGEGPYDNPFTNEGDGCISKTIPMPSFEMGIYTILFGAVPPYRYISVTATAGEIVVHSITVSKCTL